MRAEDTRFTDLAFEQQLRILPDLPYPPVIETILQELASIVMRRVCNAYHARLPAPSIS